MKKLLPVVLLASLLLALPALAGQGEIKMSTTTSTADTGLLEVLLPAFTADSGIQVKYFAKGTGAALRDGMDGNVDVVMVHALDKEEKFVAEGYGTKRYAVMHNDFVLLGPAADPAGAKGLAAVEAARRIASAKAPWVSRGDQSGTHKRELELWRKAGIVEVKWPGAISTGQGMAESARIASEQGAYLLMDRGTYLALRPTLKLAVIVDGGADLVNPYSVIVVDPKKVPGVRETLAKEVAQWLVSSATQKAIGEFGQDKFGQALFVPDAR